MCLDALVVLDPGLPAVHRAIGAPGKTVRLNVVIADAPRGRSAARHAEGLLNVHFVADLLAGSKILEPRSGIGTDQLPPLQRAIVVSHRGRDVVRLTTVAHDSILIDDLSVGEPHGAPVSATRSVLRIGDSEFPVTEQVVEIPLVGVERCLNLLAAAASRGLRRER